MSATGGSAQEEVREVAEAAVIALMGTINRSVAQLVVTIRLLVDTEAWAGHGIRSIEHWVMWKACATHRRAADLVRIARRTDELPVCWGRFEAGELTEEAMALIARVVPAERDGEVAGWAPLMTMSQLRRALRSCPEHPDGSDKGPTERPRERCFRTWTDRDGWGSGSFVLPPDEMALLETALANARDVEFRDRNGLPAGEEAKGAWRIEWADAFMRVVSEGLDGLDATLQRTGHRGERTKVVLHHEIRDDGTLGPGQLHRGAVIPESVARFLRCDAEVTVVYHHDGRIIGIDPTQRITNRAARRAIEHRDQGCAHPLCMSQVGLNVHHIHEWAAGGLTTPSNLVCLCARHHRQLHHGDFTIEGDPEAGTLRFLDTFGRPIEPPPYGSTEAPHPTEPSRYTPPTGERLQARWFGWHQPPAPPPAA